VIVRRVAVATTDGVKS